MDLGTVLVLVMLLRRHVMLIRGFPKLAVPDKEMELTLGVCSG